MTNLPDDDPYAVFKKTYFEECRELLEELEDKVTTLSVDAIDFEELNAIFRAVHSMKAGAGASSSTALSPLRTYLNQFSIRCGRTIWSLTRT